MTLFARLIVLAAALPAVFATGSHSSSCKSNEFYWGDKSLCVPYGGYPNSPSPPKGSACPSNWSWHSGESCCVPHQPPPTTPPTCSSGWGWDSGSKCCVPHTSTKPPAPTSTKPSAPTTSAPSDCKSGEWWWGDKSCCLPHGGSPNPPKPPSGSQCPSNWEWHNGKGCCVPQHPNPPPPQCGSGWGWDNGSKCCFPHGTPPPPTPSSKPGNSGHGWYKRAHKSRNVSLCPSGMDACPIAGLTGLTDDWECLDTRSELESCGGCASTGAGQDCTAIAGAWNVGCNNGKCVVYTCAAGYLRSLDNKSCVKV